MNDAYLHFCVKHSFELQDTKVVSCVYHLMDEIRLNWRLFPDVDNPSNRGNVSNVSPRARIERVKHARSVSQNATVQRRL